MQIIYEIKHKDKGYDFENDLDKEFMTECEKVDDNPPETWEKYSNMTDILQRGRTCGFVRPSARP